MQFSTAQKEMQTIFKNGAVGQAVSGFIWLVSAIFSTWVSRQSGVLILFFGGMLIFPLTQLALKLTGGNIHLTPGNPLENLGRQVAFIVPLCLPLVIGVYSANPNWYYPAFMIIIGAHYLPFITLYGSGLYAVLSAVLVGGGVLLGWFLPDQFVPGGWITAGLLLIFAVLLFRNNHSER